MVDLNHQEAIEPPKGWAKDHLSAFIDTAHNNIYATYVNKNGWFLRVLDIDSAYETLIKNFSKEADLTFCFLVMRSHASFRAACQMAMSGQTPECYMLLRGALEGALYGLYLKKHPEYEADWLNRSHSKESKSKCRQLFTYGNVRDNFRETGSKRCGISESLYETLLDYGAHPNEGSVTANATVVDRDATTTDVSLNYMVGDSLQLEHALMMTARVGACCLYIIKEGCPERFSILGLDYLLDHVIAGL